MGPEHHGQPPIRRRRWARRGVRRRSLQCAATAAQAIPNWGHGLEGSILELQAGSSGPVGLIRVIGSSWRGVGRAGRVTTLAAAVAIVAVTASWWAASPVAVATGLAVASVTIAALVDADAHRLPNALVGLAGAPVVMAVLSGWSGDLVRGALLGAALLGGPLLVTHLISPAGMGFGDVKAAAVIGAALGLLAPSLAPLGLVVALLAAALIGLARRVRTIAFGPALVAGALIALAVGRLAGLEAVQP